MEAGPVEKEVARGLVGGLAGLLGSLLPISLKKIKKQR